MYIGWADDAVARLNKNWKIGINLLALLVQKYKYCR